MLYLGLEVDDEEKTVLDLDVEVEHDHPTRQFLSSRTANTSRQKSSIDSVRTKLSKTNPPSSSFRVFGAARKQVLCEGHPQYAKGYQEKMVFKTDKSTS